MPAEIEHYKALGIKKLKWFAKNGVEWSECPAFPAKQETIIMPVQTGRLFSIRRPDINRLSETHELCNSYVRLCNI